MINAFEIEVYKTRTGKEPYTEWEESLDHNVMSRIDARLTRIEKEHRQGQRILARILFAKGR